MREREEKKILILRTQEIKALNTEEVYIVNVCCSSAGTILLSDVGTLYACGENNENR